MDLSLFFPPRDRFSGGGRESLIVRVGGVFFSGAGTARCEMMMDGENGSGRGADI